MITRATIEDALIVWLAAATSGSVIVADQNKPRPETPYLTVKVQGPLQLGQDSAGALTDPGAPAYASQAYLGEREVSVSIQAFGSGAVDLARSAVNALSTETTRSQLGTAGLFRRGGPIQVNELTALLDTDFQERAQFDVTFGLVDEYTDSVPLIESVECEGTLSNPPNEDRSETFSAP